MYTFKIKIIYRGHEIFLDVGAPSKDQARLITHMVLPWSHFEHGKDPEYAYDVVGFRLE